MRVVIDANVLIAAYAARGLCEATVELCIINDDIILTQESIDDLAEILIKKIKLPTGKATAIATYLKNNARLVEAAHIPRDACRDPDDLNVLGAAIAGAAECIISGDDDLLSLNAYEGIPIVSPRQYWELFKSTERR